MHMFKYQFVCKILQKVTWLLMISESDNIAVDIKDNSLLLLTLIITICKINRIVL